MERIKSMLKEMQNNKKCKFYQKLKDMNSRIVFINKEIVFNSQLSCKLIILNLWLLIVLYVTYQGLEIDIFKIFYSRNQREKLFIQILTVYLVLELNYSSQKQYSFDSQITLNKLLELLVHLDCFFNIFEFLQNSTREIFKILQIIWTALLQILLKRVIKCLIQLSSYITR